MNLLIFIRSLYRRLMFGQRVPISKIHGIWINDNRIDSRLDEELNGLLRNYNEEQTEVHHRIRDTHDGNPSKSYVNSEVIRIYYPNGILNYSGKFKRIKIRPSIPLEGRIRDIPQNVFMGPWMGNTDIDELYQRLDLRNYGKYSCLISRSRIVSCALREANQVHEFTSYERAES